MAAPIVSLTTHVMTFLLVTTLVAVYDLTMRSVHSSSEGQESLHKASQEVKTLDLNLSLIHI